MIDKDGAGRDLPLVWVLSTGGTIASSGGSPTDLSNYSVGNLSGNDLINAVPAIGQLARIKVEPIANVFSSDITTSHWLTLSRRINEILRADPTVAGVVVTHGTNTLEETAYFLNLTVRDDRPVVMVGAMRPATAISADGPLNLYNAIRTVTSEEARGKGVLIVMNDAINSARDATKTNTYRVETFRAPELGLLGQIDADKVSFYHSSTRRHTVRSEFDGGALTSLPKVEIVYAYVESDPAIVDAIVSTGAKGIVFAAGGAGVLSSGEKAAVRRIGRLPPNARPVLVLSSRVGNGRVIPSQEYDELEMIPADNLNPQKARVLLMLALTKTNDPQEIRRMFVEY